MLIGILRQFLSLFWWWLKGGHVVSYEPEKD